MVEFEWNPAKAGKNVRRHRVSFAEAATGFLDPLGITVFDTEHSDEEDRYITVGSSETGRLLMVAHTDRGEKIRIISARRLTALERRDYESEIQRRQR